MAVRCQLSKASHTTGSEFVTFVSRALEVTSECDLLSGCPMSALQCGFGGLYNQVRIRSPTHGTKLLFKKVKKDVLWELGEAVGL